jgi:hypothetical protein
MRTSQKNTYPLLPSLIKAIDSNGHGPGLRRNLRDGTPCPGAAIVA